MYGCPDLFLRLMASETEVFDKYLEVPTQRLSYQEYLAWLLPKVPYFAARLMFN
jgi:hypothetical protein